MVEPGAVSSLRALPRLVPFADRVIVRVRPPAQPFREAVHLEPVGAISCKAFVWPWAPLLYRVAVSAGACVVATLAAESFSAAWAASVPWANVLDAQTATDGTEFVVVESPDRDSFAPLLLVRRPRGTWGEYRLDAGVPSWRGYSLDLSTSTKAASVLASGVEVGRLHWEAGALTCSGRGDALHCAQSRSEEHEARVLGRRAPRNDAGLPWLM
jgi:hypothetical protein